MTTLKPLTVYHNKLWKTLKEMRVPDHLICLPRVKQQQLESYMKQQTGCKLGKEYVKAIYCHSAYLTYMQSNAKMPGWTKLKIAGRNIANLRYADETTLMAES